MDRNELKDRTKAFALRVMRLVDDLQKSVKGRCIADQLMRSATSVAANYRAACRARSKAEFVSKLSTVVEESDESMLWIELIIEGGLVAASRIEGLLREANEITAIMVASRKTASG